MAAKVLVVDDSKLVRTMVKRALPTADFEVVEASDGIDALLCLDQHPDVRLVICDVNMPRLGGLELLEELRKKPAFQEMPVVILTTEGHAPLVARAKAFGAKVWLTKPFKPELLLATVVRVTDAKTAA